MHITNKFIPSKVVRKFAEVVFGKVMLTFLEKMKTSNAEMKFKYKYKVYF